MKKLLFFSLLLFLFSCKTTRKADKEDFLQPNKSVDYFDASKDRKIPVAFYLKKGIEHKNKAVIIFSHGYDKNTPDSNLDYNYLLGNLA